MEEFLRKFIQLNGVEARVVLEHRLFDSQAFYCDELQTINDDDRIGVILREQPIFVDKQDVKVAEEKNGVYTISDGRMSIEIILK